MTPIAMALAAALTSAGCLKPMPRVPAPEEWTEAKDQAGLVRNPIWLKRPEARDFARNYPRQALSKENPDPGLAVLRCSVGSDGRMKDCRILAERPIGEGFGAATLKLSEKFRMARQTATGASTQGGHFDVVIRFATEDCPERP